MRTHNNHEPNGGVKYVVSRMWNRCAVTKRTNYTPETRDYEVVCILWLRSMFRPHWDILIIYQLPQCLICKASCFFNTSANLQSFLKHASASIMLLISPPIRLTFQLRSTPECTIRSNSLRRAPLSCVLQKARDTNGQYLYYCFLYIALACTVQKDSWKIVSRF